MLLYVSARHEGYQVLLYTQAYCLSYAYLAYKYPMHTEQPAAYRAAGCYPFQQQAGCLIYRPKEGLEPKLVGSRTQSFSRTLQCCKLLIA